MRRLAVACGLVVALCGCGGGDPDEVLSQTAANLGRIESGTLTFKLVVDPRGEAGEDPFGFTIEGPFAFAEKDGELAKLDVEYTQTANGGEETVRLVSTGERVFVVTEDGSKHEIGGADVEALRGFGGSQGGLGSLRVDDWIRGAEGSDGGEVGGAETDKVEGEVAVVAAVNDLVALARAFGRDVPRIGGAEARRLAESVEESSFELWSGKEDRLLRRLLIEVDFGFDLPEPLREPLGDLGARVTFELAISDPNEPVRVKEP